MPRWRDACGSCQHHQNMCTRYYRERYGHLYSAVDKGYDEKSVVCHSTQFTEIRILVIQLSLILLKHKRRVGKAAMACMCIVLLNCQSKKGVDFADSRKDTSSSDPVIGIDSVSRGIFYTKNSERTGPFFIYHETGELEIMGQQVNDKNSGTTVAFYKSGNIRIVQHWREDLREKSRYEYYDNKGIQKFEYYRNGYVGYRAWYDSLGKLDSSVGSSLTYIKSLKDTLQLPEKYVLDLETALPPYQKMSVKTYQLDKDSNVISSETHFHPLKNEWKLIVNIEDPLVKYMKVSHKEKNLEGTLIIESIKTKEVWIE